MSSCTQVYIGFLMGAYSYEESPNEPDLPPLASHPCDGKSRKEGHGAFVGGEGTQKQPQVLRLRCAPLRMTADLGTATSVGCAAWVQWRHGQFGGGCGAGVCAGDQPAGCGDAGSVDDAGAPVCGLAGEGGRGPGEDAGGVGRVLPHGSGLL